MIQRRKVNILLVEIINRNLGDSVIADNTHYLLKKVISAVRRKNFNIIPYNFYSEDYEMVSRSDLIIFDGGGIIKYKREKFYLYISRIIECAQKHDIPVYFSGVGVEGYDENDEKCQLLKNALIQPCVKGFSIRDDIHTLTEKYLAGYSTKAESVCDPAVYSDEFYEIQRDSTSHTIGIGIARYRIFEDHGMPEIDKDFQLAMWKSLIESLEKLGYQWKLFVNGLKSDWDFACEVLSYLGKETESGKYLAPRPAESSELVEQIAAFQGIVACRMHANIIAYSLGVPSIGLVWNDKLSFWGREIGYPQRFLTKDSFDGSTIAAAMHQAVTEGVTHREDTFKKSIYNALFNFIKQYGQPLARKKGWHIPHNNWQNKLVAQALGGKNFQYFNMNSPVTIDSCFDNGFQHLEVDVRLTTDGKLVCVNGWTEKTYEKLGIPPLKYGQKGMPYNTFMKCGYYDCHYPVMDFAQLLAHLDIRKNEAFSLIIDVGKPAKSRINAYAEAFYQLYKENADLCNRITIRLQTEYDVEIFRQIAPMINLMFYYPPKMISEKPAITVSSVEKYCREQGIRWISVSSNHYDDITAKELKSSSLKVCVFSYNTMGDILDALKKGADLVGTNYVSAAWMEQLAPFESESNSR